MAVKRAFATSTSKTPPLKSDDVLGNDVGSSQFSEALKSACTPYASPGKSIQRSLPLDIRDSDSGDTSMLEHEKKAKKRCYSCMMPFQVDTDIMAVTFCLGVKARAAAADHCVDTSRIYNKCAGMDTR